MPRGRAAPIAAAIITCLAILAGCFAVGWATHWGSGRAGDGHAYVASARNVLQGNWVSFEDYDIAADPKPLEQFPPGYPLMLAAGGLVGMDPVPFSRWLNLATLAFTLSLGAWLLWVQTRSVVATGLGVFVLALSPVFLFAHSNILSEASFVACCALLLAALVATYQNLHRPWLRTALLCVAALAAGWSCTLRYAGIYLIFVGVAALLLWPRTAGGRFPYTLGHRVLGALTFAFVASLLPVALAVFNLWVLGRPTSRPLAYHPPTPEKYQQLFHTVGEWLVPAYSSKLPAGSLYWIGASALLLLTVVPIVWLLVTSRRRNWVPPGDPRGFQVITRSVDRPDEPAAGVQAQSQQAIRPTAWALTLFLFAAGYTPFIVAASTFQDAGIPFNKRIFMPLWFAGWVFAVGAIGRAIAKPAQPRLRQTRSPLRSVMAVLALSLGLLLLSASAAGTFRQARARHDIGWGHEGPIWVQNKILQTIQSDHWSVAGKPLAGNGGDLVGLTTHRRSAHVPKWFSRPRGGPYSKMPDRIRQFGRWAMAEDARIVYFSTLNNRYDYLSDEARLMEQLHLKVLVEKRDGRIYEVAAIKGFEDGDYDSDGRPDWMNLDEPVRSQIKAQLDQSASQTD